MFMSIELPSIKILDLDESLDKIVKITLSITYIDPQPLSVCHKLTSFPKLVKKNEMEKIKSS